MSVVDAATHVLTIQAHTSVSSKRIVFFETPIPHHIAHHAAAQVVRNIVQPRFALLLLADAAAVFRARQPGSMLEEPLVTWIQGRRCGVVSGAVHVAFPER